MSNKILTESESKTLLQDNQKAYQMIAMQAQLIDKLERDNYHAWCEALRLAKEVDSLTEEIFNSPYMHKDEKEV